MSESSIQEKYAKAETSKQRIALLYQLEAKGKDKSVVEFYNKWADNYDQDTDMAGFFDDGPPLIEAFCKHVVDKNARIIDVAAGAGHEGGLLTKAGYTNIDAIDGSPGMLALARQRGSYKNIYEEYIHVDKPIHSVAEGSYDGLVCGGSFARGHLHGGHLKSVLSLLKSGGIAAISTSQSTEVDSRDPEHVFYLNFTPKVNEMVAQGFIEIVEKIYLQQWFDVGEDGNIWVFRKK